MGNTGQCCSGVEPSAEEGRRGCAVDDGLGVSVDNQPKLSWRSTGCSSEALCSWKESRLQADSSPSCAAAAAAAAAAEGELPAAARERCVSYADGSTYKGQFLTGKRHGHGELQAPLGRYDGEWRANVQHGEGRQSWSDGRLYEGQFRGGKFEGVGKMTWHNEKGVMTYEGEYQDDQKHGTGKFVWADGRSYNGQWHCGKRHGRGLYRSKGGDARAGYWADDKWSRWEDDS